MVEIARQIVESEALKSVRTALMVVRQKVKWTTELQQPVEVILWRF
jgi:hypothetical protein